MLREKELLMKASESNGSVKILTRECYYALETIIFIAVSPTHRGYGNVAQILNIFSNIPFDYTSIDDKLKTQQNDIVSKIVAKYAPNERMPLSKEFLRGLFNLIYIAMSTLHPKHSNAENVIKSFVIQPAAVSMPVADKPTAATAATAATVAIPKPSPIPNAMNAALAAANVIAGNAAAAGYGAYARTIAVAPANGSKEAFTTAVVPTNGPKNVLPVPPANRKNLIEGRGYTIWQLMENVRCCFKGMFCKDGNCIYIHGEFEPKQAAYFSVNNNVQQGFSCRHHIKLFTEGFSRCAFTECLYRHYTQIRPLTEIQKFTFRCMTTQVLHSGRDTIFTIPPGLINGQRSQAVPAARTPSVAETVTVGTGYFIAQLQKNIRSCYMGLSCKDGSCSYIHGEFEPLQADYFKTERQNPKNLNSKKYGGISCHHHIKLHTEGAAQCPNFVCQYRHYTQIRPLTEIQKITFRCMVRLYTDRAKDETFTIPVEMMNGGLFTNPSMLVSILGLENVLNTMTPGKMKPAAIVSPPVSARCSLMQTPMKPPMQPPLPAQSMLPQVVLQPKPLLFSAGTGVATTSAAVVPDPMKQNVAQAPLPTDDAGDEILITKRLL